MILTYRINQVNTEHQLLDTARDYFHFVTTFFEVINVSATHIYHSALELSPLLSNVRKCYYSQRPHPSPRVVIGVPDSWDPSISISAKHSYYLSSTWSPCGQFIPAAAEVAVEIWDALTLELLSTLQSSKAATGFRSGLAYSPDGCSLAGCSNAGIIIWDIQTGGIVTEIKCEVTSDGLELVWSLDGKMIGTILQCMFRTHTVCTYEISSGTVQLSSTVESAGGIHLWAHDKSFWVVVMVEGCRGCTIDIFEVGSTLTKTESFPIQSHFTFQVFSPTTYRISVSIAGDHNHDPELVILNIHNSEALLEETGHYFDPTFSPDGSLFAAFTRGNLHIWRYTSGHYIRWREFQQAPMTIQFSPTLLSILGGASTLHILHLDYTPATLATESVITTHSQLQDAFSPNGTYIATAHCGESTITITNLHSQNPSSCQFIDTGFEISTMVLTGKVLLVKGSGTVVAWLLTDEGVVDGVFGSRRADHNDSLWDISSWGTNHQNIPQDKKPSFWARLLQQEHSDHNTSNGDLAFSVGDGIAAIKRHHGHIIRIYHTGTGEILKSVEVPLHTWYRFHHPLRDECNIYHHGLHKHHGPPKYDWPISQASLQEGWVKDPEGKHQLWLHPHWRTSWNDVDWLPKVTTLRLKNPSELVIVKF